MAIAYYIKLIDSNTANIVNLLNTLTPYQISYKAEDKWNALEILEHIYLTDRLVITIISRPSNQVHHSEEIIGAKKLENIMVNGRDRKATAPEMLKPKGNFNLIEEFREAFIKQRNTLKESLLNRKIIVDNRIHKHPLLGDLTVSDWLSFIVHHTQRHLEQIKELN